MAKKKKDAIPSGFEDILGNIYSNAEEGDSITNIDDITTQTEPIVESQDDEKDPPVSTTEDGNADDTDVNVNDDTSDIPNDVVQQMNDKTPSTDSTDTEEPDEPSEADVIEAQQVGLLFEAVGQSLNWNMADIKDEDKPVTVDELTDYLKEVVKQNSVPEYADERI
jgi:hypothetical protein